MKDTRISELRNAIDSNNDMGLSDKGILKLTEGTLNRASVEFRHFGKLVAAPLSKLIEKYLDKIGVNNEKT